MSEFDYKQLDDVIHSRVRLAVMAVLVNVDEAQFTFIRDKINATDGNLSANLRKLEEAGYISAAKTFRERRPVSHYRITEKGRRAFKKYLAQLERILRP
ncbi:MAG: transcriptional regulator [Candidatus Eisenbacteria bacterium]